MSFDKNTKDYIDFLSSIASGAGNGCLNPNPHFILGEKDYEGYINGKTRKIVTNVGRNSPGALYIKGAGGTLEGTIDFPIFKGYEYRAVVDVKGIYDGQPDKNKKASFYAGIVPKDGEGSCMCPQNYPMDNRKFGILVNDVNAGDTSITYRADNPVFEVNSYGYSRQIITWKAIGDGSFRYVGKDGREYSNKGYSRNIHYGSSEGAYDTEPVDNGDGTYTLNLRMPWGEIPVKAGDAVGQSEAGGTFPYWISNQAFTLDNKWHRYTSTWFSYKGDAKNYTGGYSKLPFRQDQIVGSLMVLPNYSISDEGSLDKVESWYSTIRLEYRVKRS